METTKIYDVRYFEVADDCLGRIVKNWAEPNHLPAPGNAHAHYIEIIDQDDSSCVVACLNKIRLIDLPKAGKLHGQRERDLSLEQDEGLIEKCYLALNRSSGRLAIQQNGSVCRMSAIPRILTFLAEADIKSIVPITDKNALENDDKVVSFELAAKFLPDETVRIPKEGDQYMLDEELQRVRAGLDADPSQTLSISLSAGANIRQRKKFTDSRIIQQLVKSTSPFIVRKARVKLLVGSNAGERLEYEFVDLVFNHKKRTIEVAMEGKYPLQTDIIAKIKSCASQD